MNNEKRYSLPPFASVNSYNLLHILGYFFLILSFLDYLQALIPPNFTNPAWEFNTIGRLVELVAFPALGYLFIFFRGENSLINRKEILVLKFLSWFALIIGILFLLMLPLGISATIRIEDANRNEIANQVQQRVEELQQVRTPIEEAQSPEQIRNLVAQLSNAEDLPLIENPSETKEQLLSQINTAEEQVRNQGSIERGSRRRNLYKNSVKWNIGAFLSGVLFIYIWNITGWVRNDL